MALALVLLFLTPLSAVYGLRRAAKARRSVAAGRRPAVAQALRMLAFPAIVAVSAGMALVEYGWLDGAKDFAGTIGLAPPEQSASFYTGNGVADLFLWMVLSFGNLMVFLFFASIPYVMGSVLAVVFLLSGVGPVPATGEPADDESVDDLP